MREIKFRGKTRNGKWVYGYTAKFAHDSVPVILEDTENGITPRKIIPDTIGQFTGLLDKNGKEIYEGDIVRYDMGGKCEVSYCVSGGYAGFDLSPAFHDEEHHLTDVVVLGNIHDNPELLNE